MVKKYKYFLLFSIFFSLFFLPRIFAHLQYDTLEDEILSIDYNLKYSASELLLAPDFAHPPLWYLLMEYPTKLLGLTHSIGYYRLIQISTIFFGLLFTAVYFWKKIPHKFTIIFFLLFLTNVQLIHITSQHRMYSLVLSFGVFYSFYWFYLMKYKDKKRWQDFFILGTIAALGFFSNYSMVWLMPIFPLGYLIYSGNENLKHRIKNLFVFGTTFFIFIGWFIPIFIKNSLASVGANQWAPDLNVYNTFQLFTSYFGIIPIQEYIGELGIFSLIFIASFLLILLGQVFFNKEKSSKSILIASATSFLLFLLTVFFTGNSLLYPRTAICVVLAFYVLVADSFGKFKYSKALISLVVILQLSQFLLYFNQDNYYFKEHYFVDYRYHPIKFFADFDFPQKSCLLTIPYWNNRSAKYFLDDAVKVVSSDVFIDKEPINTLKTEECELFYLLEQSSLNREILEQQHLKFLLFDFKLSLLERYKNQNLYLLDN